MVPDVAEQLIKDGYGALASVLFFLLGPLEGSSRGLGL